MSSLSSNSRSQSSIAVAATYDSSAENFILGLQAGAELGYQIIDCHNTTLNFDLVGKAGAGVNVYDSELRITNGDTNNPDAPDTSDASLATFAELGA